MYVTHSPAPNPPPPLLMPFLYYYDFRYWFLISFFIRLTPNQWSLIFETSRRVFFIIIAQHRIDVTRTSIPPRRTFVFVEIPKKKKGSNLSAKTIVFSSNGRFKYTGVTVSRQYNTNVYFHFPPRQNFSFFILVTPLIVRIEF